MWKIPLYCNISLNSKDDQVIRFDAPVSCSTWRIESSRSINVMMRWARYVIYPMTLAEEFYKKNMATRNRQTTPMAL